MQFIHCAPSHTFKIGPGFPGETAVSNHNSPFVFPKLPGAPVAPVFGAAVPTAQGPTLKRVAPVLSAKNRPGPAAFKFTAGWPEISCAGSGRLLNTTDRSNCIGVTLVVLMTRCRVTLVDRGYLVGFTLRHLPVSGVDQARVNCYDAIKLVDGDARAVLECVRQETVGQWAGDELVRRDHPNVAG